eukprot:168496_1
MGTLVCCRCLKADDNEALKCGQKKPNYKSIDNDNNDTTNDVLIENDKTNFSETDIDIAGDNTSQLLMLNSNNETNWSATHTEQLEHELEKEIIVRQYKMSRDSSCMDKLDNILDSSLEENSDDENYEVDPRHSNLFRYTSKKSWNNDDLDEQESVMLKQLSILSKSTSTT